jgi:membrane protease subunit HflK
VAWNVPGGNGDKDKDRDPWSQRRRGAGGSPDLDQIVRNIQRRLSGLFGGGGGGGGSTFGIGLILLVAVGLWLLSGIYVVQQGERGVVLRFGKQTEITDAGPHWHLPYPIEHVEKVNVSVVWQFGIGFRGDASTGGRIKDPKESLMLTGDENIVDVGFNVQYRIADAEKYLFKVNNAEATIRQGTESAVREVVGRNTMDFILTQGRQKIDSDVRDLLQAILNRYDAGIDIVSVNMLPAQPPDEVRAAFDDVNKAREDKERRKNEAEAYANDIVPRARGAAARLVQEAQGYKAVTVARAEGDARRFAQVAGAYVKAPNVTRERLYIEAMEQVLGNATKIFIDQKAGNNLIYLPLDKLLSSSEGAGSQTSSGPQSDAAPDASVNSDARSRPDQRPRRSSP